MFKVSINKDAYSQILQILEKQEIVKYTDRDTINADINTKDFFYGTLPFIFEYEIPADTEFYIPTSKKMQSIIDSNITYTRVIMLLYKLNKPSDVLITFTNQQTRLLYRYKDDNSMLYIPYRYIVYNVSINAYSQYIITNT
jgi:hypothetical protein